jgi:hypothetical protein
MEVRWCRRTVRHCSAGIAPTLADVAVYRVAGSMADIVGLAGETGRWLAMALVVSFVPFGLRCLRIGKVVMDAQRIRIWGVLRVRENRCRSCRRSAWQSDRTVSPVGLVSSWSFVSMIGNLE